MCEQEWREVLATKVRVDECWAQVAAAPHPLAQPTGPGGAALPPPKPGPERQQALKDYGDAMQAQIVAFHAYLDAGGDRDTPPTLK